MSRLCIQTNSATSSGISPDASTEAGKSCGVVINISDFRIATYLAHLHSNPVFIRSTTSNNLNHPDFSGVVPTRPKMGPNGAGLTRAKEQGVPKKLFYRKVKCIKAHFNTS